MTHSLNMALTPDAGTVADLESYDFIVCSTSAGKDSQAMQDYVNILCRLLGIEGRIVVVHADLGECEWDGTLELAQAHADHYGNPLRVVTRIGGVSIKDGVTYKKGEVFGSILDYAEHRGMFPDSSTQSCTSDFKRGPISTVYTALAKQWRKDNPDAGRACRILDCQGLRAQESSRRAKKVQLHNRLDRSTQFVDTWYPIFNWTEAEVWACIKASGVPYHRAYDLGMPRLSCMFCIFAPKWALIIAGKENPELLGKYLAVEEKTGHKFRGDPNKPRKNDVSIREVVDAIAAGDDGRDDDNDQDWGNQG